MALSNAERQKLFRDRRRSATPHSGLTPEQISDRDAVMSEPIYPVPPEHLRGQMPRFLGWERYEWAMAPEAMIDFFGMRSAWEGWTAELKSVDRDRSWIETDRVEGQRILAEVGPAAQKVLNDGGGWRALIAAYRQDPSLGTRRKRQKLVT